jgi:beta-mannosidase
LISSSIQKNHLQLYAINDSLTDIDLDLKLTLLDFNGNEIWSGDLFAIAKANASGIIFRHDLNFINFNQETSVLKISSKDKRWLKYFSKPKDLKLQSASIEIAVKKTNNGFQIELSTSTLQKDVFLFTDEKGHFSDNFFDLLPNEIKLIEFKTEAKTLEDLQLKRLNDFIN